MIRTEAWVLHEGSMNANSPGALRLEEIELSPLADDELLVEPLFGCWEANMTHALKRYPVDVCRLRRERRVVLGNAGTMRVLEVGSNVRGFQEGDLCAVVPVGELDRFGYLLRVFGYDAPGTVGLLARRTKMKANQVIHVPRGSAHSLVQWAGFSVRYATAWDNWKVALGCFRTQLSERDLPVPIVWGWGGGVSLAQLGLARHLGCRVAMVASTDERLEMIRRHGITPIDRRPFAGLNFDPERYETDRPYRASYLSAEKRFLTEVREQTQGEGVSIFIDNIGAPVLRATLRALSRQGVVTTAGWDRGDAMTYSRISACVNRHILVHTHGCRHAEGVEARDFAEPNGWVPPPPTRVYRWEEVPELAEDFAAGRIHDYFPVYQVNE